MQAHVFAIVDPGAAVASTRLSLELAELDAQGPGRIAETIVAALSRHWGGIKLTSMHDLGARRAMSMDAFERAYLGEQYCVIGKYAECETSFRELLAGDPDNAYYLMKLGCALSYQGKDGELKEVLAKARKLRPTLTNRRTQLLFDQDMLWIEAEKARQEGDREKMRELAERALVANEELGRVYRDPFGLLYAGAIQQYFLEDIPAACKKYREVRELDPSLYPAYIEEARLLAGDGKNEPNRGEAARLLWSFIECYPESPLNAEATRQAKELDLARPSIPAQCR